MRQSFFYGTVILIVAGAVTKVLGFANRIVLSRIIGAEGMGLYQMVVPILYFLISVTTFGLPVAIAKQVAETEAAQDSRKTKRYLLLALLITSALSLLVSLVLLAAGKWITGWIFSDERAFIALLAAIPVIPIASISGVLRGYFQGKHNMTPTATSQLVEQIVRIALVVVMTTSFMDFGVEYATAGAVASIIFGECAGLAYIIWQFRKGGRKTAESLFQQPFLASLKQNRESLHKLLSVSLPVTMSRFIGSIPYVLEPMIVPLALSLAGYKTIEATSAYGQFAGMAVPLLMFPTFLTYSLSVSLVPAVAEAAYQKNSSLVHRRVYQSMRIVLVIGAPWTVLLYVLAEPLCALLYNQPEVGQLLKELAPFSVFLFFQAPLASALQGLDQANIVMRNTLFGSIAKIVAMFLLTSQSSFGIHGAVISLNLSITLITLLHFASLVKGIGFAIEIKEFLKIGFAMLAMGYACFYMTTHWLLDLPIHRMILTAAGSSLLLYLLLLVALRILGKQDVQRIPWIGEQLSLFFPRR
ncbi:stage V sporulation protein B [Brevibacillus fulvus]|uniref:Stage V sporulation protein B n=1 Tax=Brevibacillus fulvus TaxID=1125967 RepID=A0A939BRT5_9BACL|nr:stage V sporulation protein B [Brevibacillus fulvus]MBM7589982.1 stage V sporulation protein B [Brevibacillus fulvus]